MPTLAVRTFYRLATGALLALPGAFTVYLSFNAGGFFVAAPALLAVSVALVLVLRTTLAEHPFAGISGPAAIAAVALALYAIWTLASGFWSDAPARALLEFNRALLYLLIFVLFASLPRSSERLAWMVRGLALGILCVCAIGLVTRVAPDVWPISTNIKQERLSYPLTYWNALGLLAAIGILLCFHLSASLREPRAVRVIGAAAIPVLATTLYLTFSRGAIVVAGVMLVMYALLGRPRGLLTTLLSAGPATAVAAVLAYGADRLATPDFAEPAAVAQGHDLALAVGLCAAAAMLLRLLLVPLDGVLARLTLPMRARRPALALAVVLPVLAAAGALTSLDAAAYVERQYDRFVAGEAIRGEDEDPRTRLTNPANNGRLRHWEVALDRFRDVPLGGNGAGTYQLLWARHKPGAFTVNDGHSLYIEVLVELGLVGLLLLALALLAMLAGLAGRFRRRLRLPSGALYAVVLVAALGWAVRAGVDWDWEVPAVTAWMFALLGAGIAASHGGRFNAFSPSLPARVTIALGWLALALTPALAALSQHHLDRGVAALKRGDCRTGVDAALDSISALSVRPEPWEVLGYCDSRLGADALAVRALENAVERDPRSWEVHYGLAVVLAAAGRDPRPEARKALRLNPHEPLARAALERFSVARPAAWKRAAAATPLPLR